MTMPPEVLALPSPSWTRLGKPGRRTRIIVVKVDHIGDMVLAFPAMKMLREAFSHAHFTLVCAPGAVAIARVTGMFEEIIPFRFFPKYSEDIETKGCTPFGEIRVVVRDLYDLAIDMRFDIDTRPLLKHIDAYYRAGYQTEGAWYCPLDVSLRRVDAALNKSVNFHAVRRMELLASAVINEFTPPKWRPEEFLTHNGAISVPLPEDYVVLAPGAGTSVKKWPVENYAELAARIHQNLGLKVVVIGDGREQDSVAAIAERIPAWACISLADDAFPVHDVPPVVAKARAFVGNDTGFTHMAAIMNVPTLCLFSGVHEVDLWRPLGPKAMVLQVKPPCSPCQILRPEACMGERACMTGITPALVFDELCALLAAG